MHIAGYLLLRHVPLLECAAIVFRAVAIVAAVIVAQTLKDIPYTHQNDRTVYDWVTDLCFICNNRHLFIVNRNLGTWHVGCDLMSNNIAINWAYDCLITLIYVVKQENLTQFYL